MKPAKIKKCVSQCNYYSLSLRHGNAHLTASLPFTSMPEEQMILSCKYHITFRLNANAFLVEMIKANFQEHWGQFQKVTVVTGYFVSQKVNR